MARTKRKASESGPPRGAGGGASEAKAPTETPKIDPRLEYLARVFTPLDNLISLTWQIPPGEIADPEACIQRAFEEASALSAALDLYAPEPPDRGPHFAAVRDRLAPTLRALFGRYGVSAAGEFPDPERIPKARRRKP